MESGCGNMNSRELADHIEGAKLLRDSYENRVKEINRDIQGMEANLRRMLREQSPIRVGS